MRAGDMAERHFGNRRAGFQQRCKQLLVLRRIDPVMAAGEHRDRAAGQAGAMRRLIDAARQPRDDDKAGFGQDHAPASARISARRRRRCASRRWRSSAASTRRATPRTAEQGRRVVHHGKPRRISGLFRRDQADADAAGRRQARPAHRPRCRCGRLARHRHAAPAPAAAPAPCAHRRNDAAASGKCAGRHCRSGSGAAGRAAPGRKDFRRDGARRAWPSFAQPEGAIKR